jgi:cation:H+ antiporter
MSISPFVIGLTVVGFGTSTSELLVSVQAALKGVPDIAIGNIVGSNIANVLLIVGVTALVWPIHVAGSALRRDTTIMILSALALVPLFAMGEIGRVAGLTLVAGLIAYLVWTFLKPQQDTPDDDAEATAMPILTSLLWVALGLVALLFGARFLVDGAVSVAQDFGVSEAFIGLTIVAIGTSLPELATSLIAAFRHQSDIAIGNIVGSNIFNVLGILGVTSMVAPIPVAPRFLTFDLPIMIVVSIVLTGLLLLHQKIGRRTGAVMLLAYCAYLLTAH